MLDCNAGRWPALPWWAGVPFVESSLLDCFEGSRESSTLPGIAGRPVGGYLSPRWVRTVVRTLYSVAHE